ncbi:MAG TPA: SIMPL domain-containing protein [Gemmatimonadaceae bacterium]|nr:SIMPL domain-containing protein [Gemmatimonadaceae bacterium]
MSERFPQLFWGLVAVGVALVAAAVIGGSALRDVKRANDEITVTGSARRPIRSDFIIWHGSVTVQHASLQQAYADLARDAKRVRGYLSAHGVPDSTLIVHPVNVNTIQRVVKDVGETGQIAGYRLTQAFEIRSSDVDGITRLSQEISSLIADGVPLTSPPPEYHFTKLSTLRIEMLGAATKDAVARARVLAESAGGHIGPVRRADQGVFQITPRYSTEVSGYGMNDITSRDKDITAVVHVTFAVD